MFKLLLDYRSTAIGMGYRTSCGPAWDESHMTGTIEKLRIIHRNLGWDFKWDLDNLQKLGNSYYRCDHTTEWDLRYLQIFQTLFPIYCTIFLMNPNDTIHVPMGMGKNWIYPLGYLF